MSPLALMKVLQIHLNGVVSAMDIVSLPKDERKVVSALKSQLADARLDVRDYEISETRAEQVQNAKQARHRLEQIRKTILAASEYNVFSAVDVAQLTAQLEQIKEQME